MRKKNRLSSEDLRRVFLDFFAERGHSIVPASPLAPRGDSTLLFTTAGMVQFKPYYTATGSIPYRRAATVQPCLRGTDLENVGVTSRHHTFFEMLGNFSFGDYFKDEAIRWAWEFSVDVLKLPVEALWISVYEDDDEAARIWEKKIGVTPERIVRLGAKDNFWGPAGGSGACGPCSELYIDLGEERGCGKPGCAVGCDCDRYLEYWNLVFPQFDQDPDGNRSPLPNRGVDTGMGLERLAQVVQGVGSNYETDLFVPIIETVNGFVHGTDTESGEGRAAVRIVADHARALVFSINEGILPGNEGRGYVLRRILRRAVLRASRIGVRDLFLDQVAESVITSMSGAYPDLERRSERILSTIRAEEERFRRTLEQGLEIFRKVAFGLKKNGNTTFPGTDIFRLYDTYGFPVELTEEIARAEGLQPDRDGFEEAMNEQKSRSQWKTGGPDGDGIELPGIESLYTGYQTIEGESVVAALVRDGERVEKLDIGEKGIVVLSESPFYGESGGQAGDTGRVETLDGTELFRVDNTTRTGDDIPLMHGEALGALKTGDRVHAYLDQERRLSIARNHTATHLLHRALRELLGDHVKQAGSLVAPDRLRFDFVHFSKTTPRELAAVEALVNQKAQEDHAVRCEIVSYEEANARGATALFGEKYGDTVRMVSVDQFSRELCGGTHVKRTGEIGAFLIISESAVGSGVRRVEALTGAGAFRRIREEREILARVSDSVRVNPAELPERVDVLLERIRSLEKDLADARRTGSSDLYDELLDAAVPVGDVRVVAANVKGGDPSSLKETIDRFQEKAESLVAVLGTRTGDKAFLVGMVSGDLVKRGLSAGDLVGKTAARLGGRGGGKPTFAQAGGKEPEKLDEALDALPGLVRDIIEGG